MNDDLEALVREGRSARVDWVSETASVDTIAAILSAMANTHGGTLLLGVSGPAGAVTGVRDADTVQDRVLQAALAIDPPLFIPLPRVVKLGDKPIVVAHIPQGMPHVYAHDGRYLQRAGADMVALKPRDLRRLIMERGDVSFETEIARGASLDDIDWDQAKQYAGSLGGVGESGIETILQRRGCLVRQDGRLRPTHAGILLFGKEPQRYVRGAEITAVRFPGESMGDHFTRQDMGGALPDQIRKAETFLRDHLRKNAALGASMARAETLEYPIEAARELVINAVAHRDYSISGDGIRLYIYRGRMEVTSPGGLPGPVTIENIKDERFSRNPVIVQVLSDMQFIERLGYGVDRVYDLMHARRLRAPEFNETAGGFRVTLYNETTQSADDLPPPDEVPGFNGSYNGIPINPRQEAALLFLTKNPRITNSELQELCPDVHPETIRRDLAHLVAKTVLKKLGQKRGSYYVLKTD
ncbi:MAG: ATP-binding protein [Chloroflexota bacterium]|nr:ATP-binding protein [Chloroflexota bacterium]